MAQAPEDPLLSQAKRTRFPADEPYALALIDGDSYVFNHDFRNCPDESISLTVRKLFDHITRRTTASHGQIQCLANIYLYQDGLASALRRYGHARNSSAVHDWMNELGQFDSRLRIFDVGKGEDLADNKIIANLRRHIYKSNCVEIILGGTHDNGYLGVLGKFNSSPLGEKLTLLTAWTTRARFLKLNFEIISWPEVFRDRCLNRDQEHDYDPLPLTKARMKSVPRLQVIVTTASKDTITMNVDANGTILSLKGEFSACLGGTSPSELGLFYRGKIKGNRERIRACEFEGNPVVHMFHTLCRATGPLPECPVFCTRPSKSPQPSLLAAEHPPPRKRSSRKDQPAASPKRSRIPKEDEECTTVASREVSELLENLADQTTSMLYIGAISTQGSADIESAVKTTAKEHHSSSLENLTIDCPPAPGLTVSSSDEDQSPSKTADCGLWKTIGKRKVLPPRRKWIIGRML